MNSFFHHLLNVECVDDDTRCLFLIGYQIGICIQKDDELMFLMMSYRCR